MSDFVIANTEYGKVRGILKSTEYGTNYIAFLGIRYAAPPIENLRFKVGSCLFMLV